MTTKLNGFNLLLRFQQTSACNDPTRTRAVIEDLCSEVRLRDGLDAQVEAAITVMDAVLAHHRLIGTRPSNELLAFAQVALPSEDCVIPPWLLKELEVVQDRLPWIDSKLARDRSLAGLLDRALAVVRTLLVLWGISELG